MTIRIGAVPYDVGANLITGLAERPGVELVAEPPAQMIVDLRSGAFDAALLSSIEGFRWAGYRALGGVGICSRGAVRSVRAFRRPGVPIKRVGVDASSETSVALLRLLLERLDPSATPTFERVPPTREPATLPHDVVMMIGDCGLEADPGGREVIDLGEAWFDWTGLPFVFALWLVAPNAPIEIVARELVAARRRGAVSGFDDGTGGAVYYDVGPGELAGLRRFHIETARLGLADPDIAPTFCDPADYLSPSAMQ